MIAGPESPPTVLLKHDHESLPQVPIRSRASGRPCKTCILLCASCSGRRRGWELSPDWDGDIRPEHIGSRGICNEHPISP